MYPSLQLHINQLFHIPQQRGGEEHFFSGRLEVFALIIDIQSWQLASHSTGCGGSNRYSPLTVYIYKTGDEIRKKKSRKEVKKMRDQSAKKGIANCAYLLAVCVLALAASG